jgi:hypothetical protein
MFGDASARCAAPLYELGLAREQAGDKQGAADRLEAARELWRLHLGEDHPDTVRARIACDRVVAP